MTWVGRPTVTEGSRGWSPKEDRVLLIRPGCTSSPLVLTTPQFRRGEERGPPRESVTVGPQPTSREPGTTQVRLRTGYVKDSSRDWYPTGEYSCRTQLNGRDLGVKG